MYIKRLQRNICILFIAFILLLGMCFDCVQTDSFFSYRTVPISTKLSGQTSPTLESDYHTSLINEFFSSEVLGRQASAAIQKQITRRSFRTRTGKGSSFAYFLMYILPLLLSSILISEAYDFMPDVRKTSIIIRYIQLKDGKKPLLSF